MEVSKQIVREDIYNGVLTWPELQALLLGKMLADAGLAPDTQCQFKVNIEQCEEGSPGYKVSKWKAYLKLTVCPQGMGDPV